MERFNYSDARFWKRLLLLGIILNIVVCFTSELGLDTQVKMAVDENGALPWGDLRPDVAGVSDPNDGGQRVVLPLYELSEMGIKSMALFAFLGILFCLYKWAGVRSASVMSLSPALIFSVGRGYEEVYLAIFAILSVMLFTGILSQKRTLMQVFCGGIFFMSMVYSKGFTDSQGVVMGAFLLTALVLLWRKALEYNSKYTNWMHRPRRVGAVVSCLTALTMLACGVLQVNPTLGIIVEQPIRFLTALFFSILDVVFLFCLFGMAMWPFVLPLIRALRDVEDASVAMVTGYIAGLLTAIVVYVAALWSYESNLWAAEWPGLIWTMGNNGRYATMLFLPMVFLLQLVKKNVDIPTYDAPKSATKSVVLTLILLLPLSLLASLHGQTTWTDDASTAMDLEDGDHFLFVSEDTLGMHWLYTFYAPLDAEKNNITGHWRSMNSNWDFELNSSLSHVETLVTSPDVRFTPEGWILQHSGEADLLNGKGEWRVLTRNEPQAFLSA